MIKVVTRDNFEKHVASGANGSICLHKSLHYGSALIYLLFDDNLAARNGRKIIA